MFLSCTVGNGLCPLCSMRIGGPTLSLGGDGDRSRLASPLGSLPTLTCDENSVAATLFSVWCRPSSPLKFHCERTRWLGRGESVQVLGPRVGVCWVDAESNPSTRQVEDTPTPSATTANSRPCSLRRLAVVASALRIRVRQRLIPGRPTDRGYLMRPAQSGCSHPQLISAHSLADSQNGLQYWPPAVAAQLQGGCAHFLVSVLM